MKHRSDFETRVSGPYQPSFGVHRHPDVPASALQDERSSAPSDWSSRANVAPSADQFGAPARSIGDIALDPVRYMVATPLRCAALGGFAALIVYALS